MAMNIQDSSISYKNIDSDFSAKNIEEGSSVHCKENENQPLLCSSAKTDAQHQEIVSQSNDSQNIQQEHSQTLITYPVVQDFGSSSLIHVSVLGGQVIQLTSRSVDDSNRKLISGKNKSSEDVKSQNLDESMTVISADKAYILPQSLSTEGDYLLTEEVFCEDLLNASNTLPEEQVLTIPPPSSLELTTTAKPDALAIAASEVLTDSCLSSPFQDNRCLHDSGVVGHVPERDQDDVAETNSIEIYNQSCPNLHLLGQAEPLSVNDHANVNRFTVCNSEKLDENQVTAGQPCFTGKTEEQVAGCKKNRTLKNVEGRVKSNLDSTRNLKLRKVPQDLVHDTRKSVAGVSKGISPQEKQGVEKVELKEEICESLQPLSAKAAAYSDESDCDRVTTSGTNLRRSPRILKVKKDTSVNESVCLGDQIKRRKSRATNGTSRKALWDCIKCDAMFRTKASRDRHTLEGHLFTCYLCKWQGLTKTKYEIHMSTVHCSQKARCFTCRKDFPSYSEYQEHLKVKHQHGTIVTDVIEDSFNDGDAEVEQQSPNRQFMNSSSLSEDEEDADDPDYKDERNTCLNGNYNKKIVSKLSIQNTELEEFHGDGKRGCPYCGKRMDRLSHFIRHLNYHVGNKAYKCNLCSKSFVEKSGLEAHLITHSPINEPCKQCGKIFKTHRTMKRHLLTHQEVTYSCDICKKEYRHEESLRIHKSIHKEGGSGNVCRFCDKDCKTRYYLQLHMTNKHESPKFSCNVCNRSFKWKQSYRKHMIVHDSSSDSTVKHKCSTCHRSFLSVTDLKEHRISHSDERKHQCNICGTWFKREHTMAKHVKTVHLEEREYMCSQCGALFKAKAHLDQHLAHVHTTKERVKCQTCGHDFKTKSILRSHVKLVHNSAHHKYSCQACKKSFASPKDLARHNKVHTGEKDHICPVCRRCFSRKDNMISHLRTHNNVHPQSLEILNLPNTIDTSRSLQPMTSSACIDENSDPSVVSDSITVSALPSISLPSVSNSLSNTSPTCIVISSKPASSLPVVVFSGTSIPDSNSENVMLSSSQRALSSVPFGTIHSNIHNFPVTQPSASVSNLSSTATTITYCSNVNISLAPTTANNSCLSGKVNAVNGTQRNEEMVAFQPYDSSTCHQGSAASALPHVSLSSITPLSTNIESITQTPVYSSSLHHEQIVLTEEVINPGSAVTSYQHGSSQFPQSGSSSLALDNN